MSLYLGKTKIPGVKVGSSGIEKPVTYDKQTPTTAEQTQARENLDVFGTEEITEKLSEKQDVGDYVTNAQLKEGLDTKQDAGDYISRDEANTIFESKLSSDGDAMSGNLSMNGNSIVNLPIAKEETEPVILKQLNDAIAGLGTVFNLKGSKPDKESLPTEGNKIGDVWFVIDEKVGYVWLEKEQGKPDWEQLGAPIDLSGYLQIAALADGIGFGTETAMTQKATTDELNKRARFTTIRRW